MKATLRGNRKKEKPFFKYLISIHAARVGGDFSPLKL
jgi:hypothetical protein